MIFKEDVAAADEILTAIREEMRIDEGRDISDEPHVTELIYCLTKSWLRRFGPVMPRLANDLKPSKTEAMFFIGGLGLERVLLKQYRQQITEIVDGIKANMDFLQFSGEPGELKSTRMRTKTLDLAANPDALPEGWRKQMLAYMKVSGARKMLLAVFHMIEPALTAWQVEASDSEVEENWQWLLGRKQTFMEFVLAGKPPTPFQYRLGEWECTGCRAKMICDALTYING